MSWLFHGESISGVRAELVLSDERSVVVRDLIAEVIELERRERNLAYGLYAHDVDHLADRIAEALKEGRP